jgi:PRTRC genetic system ThiF family protein
MKKKTKQTSSKPLGKTPRLNKDSLYARAVLLPVLKDVSIHLIGCGGTGSWLSPHLARIAKLLDEVHHLGVRLVFWDPDVVEEKNIYRQNFCAAEIGVNKAETLAHRYGHAWGMEIVAVNVPFSREKLYSNNLAQRYGNGEIHFLVSCVDNNKARQEIVKCCREMSNIWWMDTGNIKTAGQVAVGRLLDEREASPLRFPSNTTWLPLPSEQFPGILLPENEPVRDEVDYSGLSCADIALVDEQGLSVNHAVASTAAAMLMKLLVTQDLQHHCAYVSLESGTSFVYNSPRILKKYLKGKTFVSVEGATEYDDQEDMEQAMLDEEDGGPLFEDDIPETAEAAIVLV